jgi:transcriptional regulator GlxA family with amidase domain
MDMADGRADARVIALVQYPGMTILDLVGPLQVLTILELFEPRYRTVVVGERAEPMETDVGVRMTPDRTFAEVPHPYAVVVPGGRQATVRAMSDPVLRDYVRTAAASAEVVGSVCTGSLILAALGLLEGRPATTNWAFRGLLAPFGATYHRWRWVEDGNMIMSAGVSAGIDMALHLVARLTDEVTARRVQLALDYDPRPPLGRIDWDALPTTPRLIRGALGVAAPVLTRKARRQLSSDRALAAV